MSYHAKHIHSQTRAVVGAGLVFVLLAITLTGFRADAGNAGLSAMTVCEVSELLAAKEVGAGAVSAKDTVAGSRTSIALPVALTAEDMVAKVFGVTDPALKRDASLQTTRNLLLLTPTEDSGVHWLESAGGYGIDYYGMQPEVSAMVRYDAAEPGDGEVADYGYFFIFPYSAVTKKASVGEQTEFCGTLLQEMADRGLPMDLNTATDDLFEAVGDYKGSLVDVRLLDDKKTDGNGRFILILCVEPRAFTGADYLAAE